MARVELRRNLLATAAALLFLALSAGVLALAPRAGATDAEALEGKLAGAREEASALSDELRESRVRIAGAESEATAAEAREARLTGLLAEGEERSAVLGREVERTRERLAEEQARLRRARAVLAARVVAIYESGTPDTASILLGASDYDELVARTHYASLIAESDVRLAERVGEVRDAVRGEVSRVVELEQRAVEHEERLAAARSEVGAVREAARDSAAQLAALSTSRADSLADLRAGIDEWVAELEAAHASEAEAEAEVGRWLGGPYSIPTYIVMCESGGDYGALNPSSGAGGAYQIIPSTWELYGGKGEPQNAPKAEQDRIAAEIWADSGGSAWVCA